jgi:hypothetical protein
MATSSMRGHKLGLAVEEGEFGAMKSGIAASKISEKAREI